MHHARRYYIAICVALVIAQASAATARGATPLLVPVEGETVPAAFKSASAPWKLQFTTDDKTRDIDAGDLVRWGSFVDPSRGIYVILSGNGLLVTDDIRLDGERLTGTSPTFGKWELPIDLVSAIVVRPPLDRKASDQLLARAQAVNGRSDRLLLDNGDELSGTITALDPSKIALRADAGPLDIKLDTLAAVMFDPSLIDRPRVADLRAVVGFSDGSRVTALEMMTEGDQARFKLPGGGELTAPIASLSALLILDGRAEYLSDRKPASYRHIPYLTLNWPYHADRSATGSLLRADGHLHLKGLGMHSPARITFDLDEAYQRFDAEVALDDATKGGGSVAFRVFTDDGSGDWKEAASSGIVRGRQAPRLLSADLKGAKRISLLVDFADRGDELDHADWLDARLIK